MSDQVGLCCGAAVLNPDRPVFASSSSDASEEEWFAMNVIDSLRGARRTHENAVTGHAPLLVRLIFASSPYLHSSLVLEFSISKATSTFTRARTRGNVAGHINADGSKLDADGSPLQEKQLVVSDRSVTSVDPLLGRSPGDTAKHLMDPRDPRALRQMYGRRTMTSLPTVFVKRSLFAGDDESFKQQVKKFRTSMLQVKKTV